MAFEEDKSIDAALHRLSETRADEDAWALIYKRYWPLVLAICFRAMRGDHALAEEAAQEVFVRAFMYAPFDRLQNANHFRSYLWTVARNVSRSVAQGTKDGKWLDEDEYDEFVAEVPSPGPNPQDLLQAKDLLEKILGRLGETDQELVKYLLEGRPPLQIANLIGITYGNVVVRIYRLRNALRSLKE